jgi:DNA mismatch repair protein MutS
MEIDYQKLSPMMRQYFDIKEQHKKAILFYRLGDFYEMFFDDALLASKELELTLTGRDCGQAERAPMCGIPYHAAENYIKRLIDKGYKVAICEQMEDAKTTKGMVRREVVRVITPGTVSNPDMLDAEVSNFLASIYVNGNSFGIGFADVSTGRVFLTEKSGCKNLQNDILTEFTKFSPSEIIFNEGFIDLISLGEHIKSRFDVVAELLDEMCFADPADKRFSHVVDGKNLSAKALSGLFHYFGKTQKKLAERITDVAFYDTAEHLSMDSAAIRNLELVESLHNCEKYGSLLWVLDKAKTGMGKRLIRECIEQPLRDITAITARLDAVEELCGHPVLRGDIIDTLKNIYDLERLLSRVVYENITPMQMTELGFTLSYLPKLKALCFELGAPMSQGLYKDILEFDDIANLIKNAISDEAKNTKNDGGYIKPGFNKDLDEFRELSRGAKEGIAKIEAREREATGIRGLKIGYNRVFGYYIEVSKQFAADVPESYTRRQTTADKERFITDELKTFEERALTAADKALALEKQIFAEICRFITKQLVSLQQTSRAIAWLDVLGSLAVIAAENRYTRPKLTADGVIKLGGSRHPVIEKLSKEPFVPNDVLLDKTSRCIIITGPNMAGKSTYMRQVALCVLMAHMGSFVPCDSAEIGLCDKIFTRIGASDDIVSGQSTFMVEMTEVSNILANATENSLVLLDEIGRGTSTFDGMSIARAVVEHIAVNTRCKTLFSTHYHELTDLENTVSGIRNVNTAVRRRGDKIVFLRRIVPGGCDDSFGIEVAALAGIDDKIIARAKEVLSDLENGVVQFKLPMAIAPSAPSSAADDKLAKALAAIDPNVLTPIEALSKLSELKEML